MSFIVLILVVLLEKLTALRAAVQTDRLWLKGLGYVEAHQCAAWLALVLVVALPLVVVASVLGLAETVFYGLLALPVHVLLVLYALGRGDVRTQMGPSTDALRRGDEQGAIYAAERDLGLSRQPIFTTLQQHLVWRAYEGFFAVIFWYVLLGPVVALGYRLLDLTERHGSDDVQLLAKQLRHGLDWLPSRFFAFSLALVGSFSAVAQTVMHELFNWSLSIARYVSDAALAAVGSELVGEVSDLQTLWLLLVRAAVLWYAVFALVIVWF